MEKPAPAEKRNHPRVPVQLPIVITDHRNEDHHRIVNNVSKSGCCVDSQDFTIGDRLMLCLSLSSYEPPVKVAAASVRWSDANHAGLAFLLMDTKEQVRLGRYLSQLAP